MLKVLFVLFGSALVMAAASESGYVRRLEGVYFREAEFTLSSALSRLTAGDGPSYTISTIRAVTLQRNVSGELYNLYDVQLVNSTGAKKDCLVSILSKHSIEITFDCQEEEKVVKTLPYHVYSVE